MTRWILGVCVLFAVGLPGLASATTLHDAVTANATGKNVSAFDKGSVGVAVTIAGTATARSLATPRSQATTQRAAR